MFQGLIASISTYTPKNNIVGINTSDREEAYESAQRRKRTPENSWDQLGLSLDNELVYKGEETFEELIKKSGDRIVNDASAMFRLIGVAISKHTDAHRDEAKRAIQDVLYAKQNQPLDRTIALLAKGVENHSRENQLSVAFDLIESLNLNSFSVDSARIELKTRLELNGPVGEAFLAYGNQLINYALGGDGKELKEDGEGFTTKFEEVQGLLKANPQLAAKAARVYSQTADKIINESPHSNPSNSYNGIFETSLKKALSYPVGHPEYNSGVQSFQDTVKDHVERSTRSQVEINQLQELKADIKRLSPSLKSQASIKKIQDKINILQQSLQEDTNNFNEAVDHLGFSLAKATLITNNPNATGLERLFVEALVNETNGNTIMKSLLSDEQLENSVEAIKGNSGTSGLEQSIVTISSELQTEINTLNTDLASQEASFNSAFLIDDPVGVNRQAKARDLLDGIELAEGERAEALRTELRTRVQDVNANYSDSEFKLLLYDFLLNQRELGVKSMIHNENLDSVNPYILKDQSLAELEELRDLNKSIIEISKQRDDLNSYDTESQQIELRQNIRNEFLSVASLKFTQVLGSFVSDQNADLVVDVVQEYGDKLVNRLETADSDATISGNSVLSSGEASSQSLLVAIKRFLKIISDVFDSKG